ncbi:hypothetical protein MRX96_017551 [Rhipicephalus microplus]
MLVLCYSLPWILVRRVKKHGPASRHQVDPATLLVFNGSRSMSRNYKGHKTCWQHLKHQEEESRQRSTPQRRLFCELAQQDLPRNSRDQGKQ